MTTRRQLFSQISIHAPAKGATESLKCESIGLLISIHAPAKGATMKSVSPGSPIRFQSTLPRRERPLSVDALPLDHLYFNPRSREGSDDGGFVLAYKQGLFQSTLPRRERP